MKDLTQGLIQAFELIFSFNLALYEIIWLSLYVAGVSLILSTIVGIPIGAFLGLTRFPGRRLVMATASYRIYAAVFALPLDAVETAGILLQNFLFRRVGEVASFL